MLGKPPDALDACAREPIHVPGAIQPHGALVAFQLPGFTVTHWSGNCAELAGVDFGRLAPGEDLRHVLPRQFMHDLGNTLQATAISRVPERLMGARLDEASPPFDVIAHATEDGAICEFLPADGADTAGTDVGVLLRTMSARLGRASAERFLPAAAQQVRAVTGYDRVMIYRFRPDGSGVVVAESQRPGLDPFLGLHYPASDIPPQARELYRRQLLRQIVDVDYVPVPVLARDAGAPPLDMSLAQLRSVSPVHLEYLRNMGSRATLTISIMRGDALWGLIACHHETPRRLSSSTCVAMELFAQMFSLQLQTREQTARIADLDRAHALLDRVREAGAESNLADAVAALRADLAQALPHDGIALWLDGRASIFGSAPPPECLPELARHVLARHVTERRPDAIYATNTLSAELPDAVRYVAEASGAMAIPLGRGRSDVLFLFRKEQIQTVRWGGDPNAPVLIDPQAGRIGPRQSFAAWQETVRAQSLPWTSADIHVAEALQVRFLEHMLSHARFVDDARRVAEQSQGLLIAELNHRVKNILALIRSVIRQSRGAARSVEDYASDLERRIGALAVAHDQVTQAGWRPASLRRLVEEQGRTWSSDAADRIAIAGPPVQLDVRALQAVALVLHEMMTNAAKYGALSTPGGRIAVEWGFEGADLVLRWRESGGPLVRPPTSRGFGTVVIEQTIPFELRGATDVRYLPGGVEADFRIPGASVRTVEAEEAPPALKAQPAIDLSGARVLLVEDSMMIALDAQAALESLGAGVEIAASVADGLRAIALNDFTMAVLDVNLYAETSDAVADALTERGVPFIFATGYGDRVRIPDRHRHVPKVSKPYDAVAITQAIAASRIAPALVN